MIGIAGIGVIAPILARSGRGLGRLIEGLTNGDPTAWTILGGGVALMVAINVFKRMRGDDD